MTFAERVISFNKGLKIDVQLPHKIEVMNPFEHNPNAMRISSLFYQKYYSDTQSRKLILGINPGRFGAGVTGIPFTDTKRLKSHCEIEFPGAQTHEPSSVFVYKVVEEYGGSEAFFNRFYINSVSPLGFVQKNKRDTLVNYNYYDSKALTQKLLPFIKQSIVEQTDFGIDCSNCYCLGSGKNYQFLDQLNRKLKIFGKIIPLEHPRYVMQYKSKLMNKYVEKYLSVLGG